MEHLSMNPKALPLIAAALLIVAGPPVAAGPSSHVAWDSATRALVASGDPSAGERKAAACAGCHGKDGIGTSPTFPNLAGQLAAYLYKQLRDYKDGTRADSAIMSGAVAGLSDRDMADLAAWYASLDPPPPQGEPPASDVAARLADGVGGTREFPPCGACHGARGEGKIVHVPALAGQKAAYLESTLRNYRDGKRANDVYARMRSIAAELTDEQIEALAAYYAAKGR
jgi:cytochrome c553